MTFLTITILGLLLAAAFFLGVFFGAASSRREGFREGYRHPALW